MSGLVRRATGTGGDVDGCGYGSQSIQMDSWGPAAGCRSRFDGQRHAIARPHLIEVEPNKRNAGGFYIK